VEQGVAFQRGNASFARNTFFVSEVTIHDR
jgi:hypothetical protein